MILAKAVFQIFYSQGQLFLKNYHEVGKIILKLTQDKIIHLLWAFTASPYPPGYKQSILLPTLEPELKVTPLCTLCAPQVH